MKTITKLFIIALLFISTGIQAQEYCFECEDNFSNAYKSSTFGFRNRIDDSASYSSAFGFGNSVTGESSAVLGIESRATGKCSFVIGWLSESTRNFSTVIGSKSKVNGLHSYVIGYKSEISWGDHGYIFGSNCLLPGGNGFLIGNKLTALTDNVFIIGDGGMDTTLTNDVEHSLVVGFNSNLPTLHVGPSAGPGRTGKIGIGNVTSPSAKLHIRADAVEHARLRIENTNPDKEAAIIFGDGTQSITTSQEMPFTFNSGLNDYFFENGRVGIGTSTPDEKLEVAGDIKAEGLELSGDIFIEDIDHGIIMKSPDGNCWRGTLNNLGQLQFTQVDCGELTVSTPEPEPAQNSGIRIYPNPTGNRVTVEIPAGNACAQLSIKSSGGRELAAINLSNISNHIDMAGYPAGIYFFYISSENGKLVEVKKVVKE